MKKIKITKVTPQTIETKPIEIHKASEFILMTTDKKGLGQNISYSLDLGDSTSVSGGSLII